MRYNRGSFINLEFAMDIKGRKSGREGNLRHKRPHLLSSIFHFPHFDFFLFVFQLKRCSINREIINSKEIKAFMEEISFALFISCSPLNAPSFFCSPQHCNILEKKYINFLPYTPIERRERRRSTNWKSNHR